MVYCACLDLSPLFLQLTPLGGKQKNDNQYGHEEQDSEDGDGDDETEILNTLHRIRIRPIRLTCENRHTGITPGK